MTPLVPPRVLSEVGIVIPYGTNFRNQKDGRESASTHNALLGNGLNESGKERVLEGSLKCVNAHYDRHYHTSLHLMTSTSKSTRRPPTPGKQKLQMLLGNPLPHETIRSEVQLAAGNGNINAIRRLAVGDQEKLLEIIDQVCTCHPNHPFPSTGW